MFIDLRASGFNSDDTAKMLKEKFPQHFDDMTLRSVYTMMMREITSSGLEHRLANAKVLLPKGVGLPTHTFQKMEVPYEDCLLFSDNHLYCHDVDWIAKGLVFMRTNDLKAVVLNGDTIDGLWASAYVNFMRGDAPAEFDAMGKFLHAILEHGAERIYIVPGNHEKRLGRQTQGALQMTHIIAMSLAHIEDPVLRLELDKITHVTNYPWMRFYGTPDQIDWLVGHPMAYRQLQLSVAAEMAQKYQTHIALGHEHHKATGVDKYSRYQTLNLPCTMDPGKAEYKALDFSPRPEVKLGFGWIVDGYGDSISHVAPEQWIRRRLEVPL